MLDSEVGDLREVLVRLAREVADAALHAGEYVVLAESCTAGLVAHTVSLIPGVSEWFCGSAVVYRNETKTAWLQVPAEQLEDPRVGPVSRATAAAMCRGVLARTPQATLALSITGHLGPHAPPEQDGLMYLGVATASANASTSDVAVTEHQLAQQLPADSAFAELRLHRQYQAAVLVLQQLLAALQAKQR